jgi:hypothetical protein
LKQVLTSTAFAIVLARNAWRDWYRQLRAEQRARVRDHQRGWGG